MKLDGYDCLMVEIVVQSDKNNQTIIAIKQSLFYKKSTSTE